VLKRSFSTKLLVLVLSGGAIISWGLAERIGFPTDSTPERESPEAARAGWIFHVIDNRGNGADGVAVADVNGDGQPDAILLAMDWPGSRLAISRLIDPAHPARPGSWSTSFLTHWYSGFFLKVRAIADPKRHLAHLFAGSHSNHFHFPHAEAAVARSDLQVMQLVLGKRRVLEHITKADLIEPFDVDRDGVADLVVADNQRFGWYSNPGSTDATAPWIYHPIGTKIKQFGFCDLDGDGITDIVGAAAKAGRPADVVGYWYEGSRDRPGEFSEHPIRVAGKNPADDKDFAFKGIACGDVNGDGVPDLVLTGSGPGYGVIILTRTADSAPAQAVWTVTPITPWSLHRKYDNVVLADLDGDGDLDIVTCDETDGDFTRGLGVVWFENKMASLRARSVLEGHAAASPVVF
jgi:hypothetical protein